MQNVSKKWLVFLVVFATTIMLCSTSASSFSTTINANATIESEPIVMEMDWWTSDI